MRNPRIDEFVGHDSWFDRKYRAPCSFRFPTLKLALNLWAQLGGQTIVETGCIRLENDFGAGCSTVLFAEVTASLGGRLWSVDNNPQHVELATRLTSFQSNSCRCVCADSVEFLDRLLSHEADFSGRIDLLYLDSLDYPLFDLLVRIGLTDVEQLRALARDITDEELAERHCDLVGPAQQHCLLELNAALPLLHDRSVILIDDNDLPGGGKPRLAKKRLRDLGWNCLLDSQQTLWVPGSIASAEP